MGKTGKWFRSLLSSKKSPPDSYYTQTAAPAKEEEKKKKKSKWALSKSNYNKSKNGDLLANHYAEGMDANKHAIAVAAATAVVAEAALAAAQAAAEVVRLTSGGGTGKKVRSCFDGDRRRVTAAIKIQSAFRAYLARRALRALKGLVKLQALVRGNIVRKQSAEMLRRMQAMARIQARASAHRSYPGFANPRNYHHQLLNNTIRGGPMPKQYNSRSHNSNRINNELEASNWLLDHWMEQSTCVKDDERSDKILEIDTWKPRRHITTRRADRTFPTLQSFSSHDGITEHEYSEIGSLSRFAEKLQKPINPSISSKSSPKVRSAFSRPRGAVTPRRSECSRSFFGDYYVEHPNYMANTESSLAKVGSQSVPKQRFTLDEQRLSTSWCA